MDQEYDKILDRFIQHFGRPVPGRVADKFTQDELVRLVEKSVAENRIDPKLREEDRDRTPEHLISTPAALWELVVSADDDTVESDLLEWSGLEAVWERCQERWARNDLEWDYDFLSEVVEACSHAFLEREEWDGGAPGRSGVWHCVGTDNPAALRRELRFQLARQLWAWRRELRVGRSISPGSARASPAFLEGAEFFNVDGVPVVSEVIRGWGGHGKCRVVAFDAQEGRAFSREVLLRDGQMISREKFDALVSARHRGSAKE